MNIAAFRTRVATPMLVAVAAASCSDDLTVPEAQLAPQFTAKAGAPAPPASELKTVTFGGSSLTLWPYTGTDFPWFRPIL